MAEQKLNKAQQVRLIREAFLALPEMTAGFTSWKERLLDETKKEEREHRGFPHRERCGITIQVAGELMAVVWIARYLDEVKRRPALQDLLSIRYSCMITAALVDRHENELRQAWEKFDIATLANDIDYAFLMA